MDSLIEAKVNKYLQKRLNYQPHECGAVLNRMRTLARTAGFELNHRFASAGLAVGPNGRCASNIVSQALLDGCGDAVTEYEIRNKIDEWIRTTGPMGG